MILSLVLSKIKFRSRIISAAPPTHQGHSRTTTVAGLSDLARGGIGTGSCVLTLPGY